MNFLRVIGLFLCVFVVLSVWGCLPEPKHDYDGDISIEQTERESEYRIKRKLKMLQNNENY
jgi:hypothetical protein